MSRPRASDHDDKRRAILDRSAQLFAEHGYDRASTSMIAQACGVSKANLYHYYKDKEGLLFDVIRFHLKELLDVVEAADNPDAPLETRLHDLIAALLDGGGIDYTEIGAIRWSFAIAPDHPLAFMPEPISESQLRLYPNIMVEDTAHTINKKVGWLLHGQEAILVPDFNTKCQCQILGEGIGFLPEYMAREAVEDGLLVTRRINNPRQDSRMLLATQHAATGQVTRWIKQQFGPAGVLTNIYSDLLWRA